MVSLAPTFSPVERRTGRGGLYGASSVLVLLRAALRPSASHRQTHDTRLFVARPGSNGITLRFLTLLLIWSPRFTCPFSPIQAQRVTPSADACVDLKRLRANIAIAAEHDPRILNVAEQARAFRTAVPRAQRGRRRSTVQDCAASIFATASSIWSIAPLIWASNEAIVSWPGPLRPRPRPPWPRSKAGPADPAPLRSMQSVRRSSCGFPCAPFRLAGSDLWVKRHGRGVTDLRGAGPIIAEEKERKSI